MEKKNIYRAEKYPTFVKVSCKKGYYLKPCVTGYCTRYKENKQSKINKFHKTTNLTVSFFFH